MNLISTVEGTKSVKTKPSKWVLYGKRTRAILILIVIVCVVWFLLGKVNLLPDGVLGKNYQKSAFPEAVYGVPVITELLDEKAEGRPGTKREIKYVVIHETGNKEVGTNAKNHSTFLQGGEGGTTSWHYTVDDKEIYHHIPDDEIAWHAGDGTKEDGGNVNGIGIELCVNPDGDFEKTFQNGAKLAAYLLKEYKLTIDDMKMHGDFIEKNCPESIMDNDRWQEFLEKVSMYMKE